MRTKLFAFLLVCSATTGGAETLVLKAGRLVDGRGGGPWSPPWCDWRRPHRRSGRAGSPSTRSTRSRPRRGHLLPGFIDLHTHLTDKEDIHWEEVLLKTTPSQAALWGARNARITLEAASPPAATWDPPGPTSTWTCAMPSRREPSPARACWWRATTSPDGGSGRCAPVLSFRGRAHGPQPGRRARRDHQAVRTNFKHGADHIKILVTGAMLSKESRPSSSRTPTRR